MITYISNIMLFLSTLLSLPILQSLITLLSLLSLLLFLSTLLKSLTLSTYQVDPVDHHPPPHYSFFTNIPSSSLRSYLAGLRPPSWLSSQCRTICWCWWWWVWSSPNVQSSWHRQLYLKSKHRMKWIFVRFFPQKILNLTLSDLHFNSLNSPKWTYKRAHELKQVLGCNGYVIVLPIHPTDYLPKSWNWDYSYK